MSPGTNLDARILTNRYSLSLGGGWIAWFRTLKSLWLKYYVKSKKQQLLAIIAVRSVLAACIPRFP